MPRSEPSPSARDAGDRVQAIAEAVAHAWHHVHGHGRLEVPLSVVAALALIAPQTDAERADAERIVSAFDAETCADFTRMQFRYFVRGRPDLVPAAAPLLLCWWGPAPLPDQARQGAAAVARAATAAGQLTVTGKRESREAVDLLGTVLTTMRGRSSAGPRGQFYTPAHIAELMAELSIAGAQAGQSVFDPAVGTGGMLRAAAAVLRRRGIDPAAMIWGGTDIDETAVACAAVNAALWGLGPQVYLTVADALREDPETAVTRARRQRDEALEIAETAAAATAWTRAFAAVCELTEGGAASTATTENDLPQ